MRKDSIARSFLIFALLLAFTIGMIGIFSPYFTFLHRQSFQLKVKQEKTDDTRVFTFSEEKFQKINWEERNVEFEFNGKMYDVASIEFKEGVYSITCENDFIEDMILGFLKSDSKSKSKSPQIQLSEPENLFQPDSTAKSNSKAAVLYDRRFSIVAIEKTSPPPRVS